MWLSVAKRHERGTKMQKSINYTLKDTKSLKPYERNPRDNDKAVDAAAERAAAERWKLSEREKEIVKSLGQ